MSDDFKNPNSFIFKALAASRATDPLRLSAAIKRTSVLDTALQLKKPFAFMDDMNLSITDRILRDAATFSGRLNAEKSLLDKLVAKPPRYDIEKLIAPTFRSNTLSAVDIASLATDTSRLNNSITAAAKALSDVGKANSVDRIASLSSESRRHRSLIDEVFAGSLGTTARVNQWTMHLSKLDEVSAKSLFPKSPDLTSALSTLHEQTLASMRASGLRDQQRLSEYLGLNRSITSGLDATMSKMSAYAGVYDMFGIAASATSDAYRSLFGEWHTRPDLPDVFWRDGRARRRMYRDADVDPGLVEANLNVAVEVVVESGLAGGLRSESSATAVFSVGEVSMSVRTGHIASDAHKMVGTFELQMREFIARKLSEKSGENWFKERASSLVGRAKDIRKQALQRGEEGLPLIHYVDLGDLATIIKSKSNWADVFAEVFINQTDFDLDMQRLVAVRRPTMHFRPIDAVRLVELFIVIQRLSQQMRDDGAWSVLADFDQ